MANRELVSGIEIIQSLIPATLTTNNTTVAGAAIDVSDCDTVTFVSSHGAWGDTVGGIEIAIQHGSDTVNFVDVPNDDIINGFSGASTVTGASVTGVFAKINAAADGSRVYVGGYVGNRRYVRHKITATGNQAVGTPTSINVTKGRLRTAPSTLNKGSSV